MIRRFIHRFFRKPETPEVAPTVQSHILWKGRMSPFSNERLAWIEARLFCLARMAHALYQTGQKRAQQITADYQEAHLLYKSALQNIHTERLELMVERQVIDDYNKDQEVK